MPDIFLSYNREDQARAKLFAETFAAQGFKVWWDVGLQAGEAYDEVTETALRTAKAVVVLWSKKSVVSRWVRAEATLADRNKTLVPCMIEPCERPIMFELTQTAELAHWQGDASDKAWVAFVADIRRFIARHGGRAGTPPVEAAPSLREIIAEPSKPPETMLAVLPFDNLSADPEMAFFSDGVSEDILGRLSRGSKLKVIGKTSCFQFRGADKPKAAAALKATHVLDGSIRRAGGKVRIAAHLTEIAGHTTLWADKYDRGLEDVFAVQDEISEAIAEALNATFFPQKTAKIDPQTYDLYLRNRSYVFGAENMRAKIAALEAVTRIAPDFADAWGELAHERALLRIEAPIFELAVMRVRTEADLARCLALDPTNAKATDAEYQLVDPFGDFMAAEDIAKRMRANGQNSPYSQYLIAVHLESVGRVQEALGHARRGAELAPLDHIVATMVGQVLMWLGRRAESRAIAERLLELLPDNLYNTANLLLVRTAERDWAGVDALKDYPLRELSGLRGIAGVARAGTPEARQGLRAAIRRPIEETGYADIAPLVFLAHFGFANDVFELLEKSKFGPSGAATDVRGINAYRTGLPFHAEYPELRKDPRFPKLAARLGLVEYWLASQKWPDCVEHVPYDFRAGCEAVRHTPKDRFGV